MKRTNHKVASGLLATVLLLTPSAPVLAAGTGISPVKSVPNPKVGVVHKAKSIQTNGTTTAAKVQALHGTVNPLVASGKAKRVNETDPNRLLRLGFVLQPRNEALMTSYATSGKKLTVSQFKADFAPTSTAVSTVKDFLVKGNLKVVSQTDDLLMIEGTAAQLEKALHVKFNNYQLKNYKFYANENDPVLPTEVKVALKGIIGLNQTPYSTVPVHKYVDYGQNDYFTPDAVRSSYGMIPAYGNGIDGSNRNIAILMTGDYSDDDVKKFSQTFGIPYNASKFVRRHVPGTSPAYGIDEESTLDVQWAHAIAPGATITEYETGTLDDVNLYAGLDTIINSTPTTDVINMSFGAPESFLSPNQLDTWHSKFVEAVAKGITPIASSGDNGAFAREFPVETVSSPASDPFVLAVGGTTLALDEKNNRTNETAWGEAELGSWDPGFTWGSGGGYSTVFSDFTGQTAQKRGVPDVSMLAQNIEMYEEQDGGWFTAAGTSFSGPMWSGIIALAAQKANHGFGWIRPAINNIATNADTSNLFRDITEGNNGDYSASAGWDPVTGWGSPANGWTLVQALAAQQKNNGTAGPLISGTVVGSEAFDYSQNIMNGVGTVDLIGSGFGTAKGTVTLTDAQGNHFNVPQNNWTDSDITLNIDSDSGLFGQPNHPSKAGTYQITLKKASGETSNAIPVQLGDFYQVSHQGETPVSGIDNPIYQDVQVDLYRPDGEPDTTYPNGTASIYIGSDNYWVDEQPVFLVQQNGQSCPMNADGSFRIQVVNGQASVQVATNRVGDYHYGVESANGVFGSDPDVASFTSASSTATRLINMNTEELSYAPAGGTNYVNVALSDSYGNLVNAHDSVHVTLSDATGHVTVNDQPISAATPTDVTLDAGNAYLTVGDDKAEQITLTFTDTDNQQVTPLAVTLTFTAATQIAIKSTQQQTHVPVSGSGQEQESNWQYLQVEAEDAHGTVVPFAGVSFLSVMSTGSYSGNHLGTYHVQARVNNVWQDVPSNEWDAYQLDLSQGSIAVRVSSDVADQVVYRAYIVLNTDNSMYDLGGSFVAGPADALETYVQLPHMATSPASTPQYAPVEVGVFDAFQNLIESNDTIQLTERAGGPSVSVAVRNEQGVMIPVTPHNGVWTLQMSQLMNQTVFFTSTQPGVAHFDLTDVTDNHVQAADFQIAFVNSVSTSLKAATPASVVVGGKQTVEVDMIDQNGQTVINGDDQIGLSISKHSGKVTVTDRDGNALQADANGRFVVNAHAGAALFLVTDDAAETLTYSFTDLTVTRVSATSVTGMFAAPAKYVLSSIAP
ncbi:MAG: S53 family peptidase, partial [Tumebacillaceae bacterium]